MGADWPLLPAWERHAVFPTPAPFGSALAQSATGHSGAISDPFWSTTLIKLVPHRSPSVLGHHRLGRSGEATPSALQGSGSAFSVSYSPLTTLAATSARSHPRLAGALVHRAFEAP